MLQGLSKIIYYAICLTVVLGIYTWGSISGTKLFGDDNKNNDGHTFNSSGSGHLGGHGYYFHK